MKSPEEHAKVFNEAMDPDKAITMIVQEFFWETKQLMDAAEDLTPQKAVAIMMKQNFKFNRMRGYMIGKNFPTKDYFKSQIEKVYKEIYTKEEFNKYWKD